VTRIALLSTSDTDLLSARASGADYVYVNPSRAAHTEMAEVFAGADLILARILGSPQSLCTGFARIRGEGQPMVVLGGEQAPDAALMELSTVPMGVAADAHAVHRGSNRYLTCVTIGESTTRILRIGRSTVIPPSSGMPSPSSTGTTCS
jgi:hypothetical protein